MSNQIIQIKDGQDNAFPISNESSSFSGLTGDGYCKMPDGTLMCWGVRNNVTVSTLAFTFPIPFADGCLPSVMVSTGAGEGRFPIYAEDVTFTTFNAYMDRGGYSSLVWVRYFAIGRWK